jgi:nucleoside-diphosphate-sugar epimerase
VKVLILGGTRFLGRALVEEALSRRDEVTLFNRGRTNPELFPQVKKLRRDRAADLSLLEGRTWDAVVDVAAYHPRVVGLSAEALRDRVGRYTFVSTVSVYADQSVPPVEGAAVAELTDPDDESAASYGARKAACEGVVESVFGERALVVRPGLIVGPHDPTDRFTYWPRRLAAGGEVLAPGDRDDPVQFVDVRDLAAWILRATAEGGSGVFNATGRPLGFGRFLDEARRALGSHPSLAWVPSEQLLAAGVEEWMGVPLWIASADWEAVNKVDVSKAIAAGLSFRPLAETVRDTLAWDRNRGEDESRAEGVGLDPMRERELFGLA